MLYGERERQVGHGTVSSLTINLSVELLTMLSAIDGATDRLNDDVNVEANCDVDEACDNETTQR